MGKYLGNHAGRQAQLDTAAEPPTSAHNEHARLHGREQPMLMTRLINLALVIVPFVGLIAAMVLLWGVALNWSYLAVFALMYVVTVLGVTVGYHRLFTHHSFKTPRFVEALLAVCGSMAIQGPVLDWVADHRRQHQHRAGHEDPHSPHMHGSSLRGTLSGFVHAHLGWFFGKPFDGRAKYVGDFKNDRLIAWMHRLFPVWVRMCLCIPAALGGLFTMSWMGVLLGFIWGGLVRVFFVHHVTWSVNSICHLWGTKPYKSHDESRNNAIFGVLAFGEGWHSNPHAFPTSARRG